MSDLHAVQADTILDDRYRIISRIGSGGMADVYAAEDLQLGRKVALKLLYRRFAEDAEFVERFRREASAAAGLQHPNVVQVYDRGAWDGTYYIAMEYLEGRSLKSIIREHGALDPQYAVDVATQVLRALRFAHKRGIIHRDIKPHNVIVDPDGRVKVTDFGIARAGASDMTETGAIMGTAQYLSPEQAQGHPISAAADIYSVGIVLYEMLTGRLPFDAESAVTIALKQVSEEPVPPRQLNPQVSPELEDVVLCALQKDPRRRFADADEFIEALDRARDLPSRAGDTVQRTGSLTGVYPAPVVEEEYPLPADPYEAMEERDRRSARFWLTLLLIALALAALGAGAYLLLKPQRVAVPDVVGRQADTAATILDRSGFEVDIQEVRSRDVPRDEVARQDPSPGDRAEEGSVVTIYVSGGPGEATIPEVADLTRREAERRLERAGFKVDVREEFSDTVRRGRVIETLPPERSQLEIGRTVTLVVSRGREEVVVPDVRDLDREEARRRLEEEDLEVSVQTEESTEEDPGQVLSQDPAPGTELEKGSTVTLTVAEEPSEVEVPDVEGDTVNDALEALTEAGFRPRTEEVEVDNPEDDDIVLGQDPPAGEQRPRGSRVTIQVGRFVLPQEPDPEPTPTATP